MPGLGRRAPAVAASRRARATPCISQERKQEPTRAAKEGALSSGETRRAEKALPRLQPGPKASQIATGWRVTYALDAQGRLYAWQFGGEPIEIADDAGVGHFADWEAIDADSNNLCGLRAGGQLYCRGISAPGESMNVRRVSDWSGVRAVSAGISLCAILADGTLHCMGVNASGTLGIGPATDLTTCSGMPCSLTPRQVGSANDWQEIEVNGSVCGRRGGDIYCWGDAKAFGSDPKRATKCTSLGYTVRCHRSPVPAFTQFHDWAELAVGIAHVCARRANGDVYCRGDASYGQLGPRQPVLEGASEIASGNTHSCALVRGSIWCWGNNSDGQLGDGAAKHSQGCPLKTRRGAVSDCSTKPVEVPPPPSGAWLHLALGEHHSCAIASDLAVYCWGAALLEDGRCGNE